MKALKKTSFAVQAALLTASLGFAPVVFAQDAQPVAQDENFELERIMVTAQKRSQNAQEVPVSVAALSGEGLEVLGSSGMDVRQLSARIPSLLIESSFGRTFPRFYVRGLGNTDFDLLASQPVSLVYDDVVLENALLKGFPVFDIERVEVLRGPQGTLFGRNTPAGIVKFDSKKPTADFDAYVTASYGSFNSTNLEGAVGGALAEDVNGRVALLKQHRSDYIDNRAPGFEQEDQLGGYDEKAGRVQLAWNAADNLNVLFNYHFRDAKADARIFYANIIEKGTNNIIDGFDREVVQHDAGARNHQWVKMDGGSVKVEWDLGSHTITSVTGLESAEIYSVGDIDGGYGAAFLPDYMGPGFIPFPSETAAGMPDHQQFTQEIRFASNELGDLDYQVGAFFFDEDLTIENYSYDTLGGGVQNGLSRQNQVSKSWALFASADYQFNEKLNAVAGVRYSYDERDWDGQIIQHPFGGELLSEVRDIDDSQVSWDLSATYKFDDNINLYARVANGYRAPSIQGRSLLFGEAPTMANAETMLSFETGFKAQLLDNRARINGTIFHYTVSDQQLTAVGGENNGARLLNADKTEGYGFELETQFAVTQDFLVTAGISYNHTEIKDAGLLVAACGADCTILDPVKAGTKLAYIDGNSLPQSPEWIANMTARYSKEMFDGEVFVFTDWAYRSKVNFFLYEATEFTGDALLEGGVRVGYNWAVENTEYQVAAFVRNITDELQLTGAIDFNNLTGYVNEPRFVGIEFTANFF